MFVRVVVAPYYNFTAYIRRLMNNYLRAKSPYTFVFYVLLRLKMPIDMPTTKSSNIKFFNVS
jgi:hypothetical protein